MSLQLYDNVPSINAIMVSGRHYFYLIIVMELSVLFPCDRGHVLAMVSYELSWMICLRNDDDILYVEGLYFFCFIDECKR